LEKLIPLLAQAGATGLLIEWEDTFPYESEQLKGAVSGFAYSRDEVRTAGDHQVLCRWREFSRLQSPQSSKSFR